MAVVLLLLIGVVACSGGSDDEAATAVADEASGGGDGAEVVTASAAQLPDAGARSVIRTATLRLGTDEVERTADEALALVEPFPHDFMAAALAARARLSRDGRELDPAFEAWDRGDHAGALDRLQAAFAEADDPEERDAIRQAMVGIFTELGPADPLAREHRRRLAAALH